MSRDGPRHTKLRALISQAFTPRSVASLEPRIRELCRQLLAPAIERGQMDLAVDFAIPLPMMVIAEMIGIPVADRAQFKRWNDVILDMSYTVPGGEEAPAAVQAFRAVTFDMNTYRSPLQWMFRVPRRDIQMHSRAPVIPAGKIVLNDDRLRQPRPAAVPGARPL